MTDIDPHAPLRVLTREEMNEIIRPKDRTERAIEEGGKTCLSCGEWKPLDQFHRATYNNVADRKPWCKQCFNLAKSRKYDRREKQGRSIRVNKWWKGSGR